MKLLHAPYWAAEIVFQHDDVVEEIDAHITCLRAIPVHGLHFSISVAAFINVKIVFSNLYLPRRRDVEYGLLLGTDWCFKCMTAFRASLH